MLEIQRINISDKKSVLIGLTKIYGVGKSTVKKLLKQANIKDSKKIKDLSFIETQKLRTFFYFLIIESSLRKNCMLNLKKLIENNSYRGNRFLSKLPMNGQRTRTNSKTRKKSILPSHFLKIAQKKKYYKKIIQK